MACRFFCPLSPLCHFLDPICSIHTYKGSLDKCNSFHIDILKEKLKTRSVSLLSLSPSSFGQIFQAKFQDFLKSYFMSSKDENITLTLWEQHGYSFDASGIINKSENGFVIAIFCGMTIRKFKEKTYVCSTSATKCYIDDDFPEVSQFKSSLNMRPLRIIELASMEAPICTPAQERNANRCTIIELLSLNPNEHQGKKFTCIAEITHIDNSKGWWYASCRTCGSAMREYENKMWCTQCWNSDKPIALYKINFIVKDKTGMANFLMFSNVANQFIAIPAQELISYTEHSDQEIPGLVSEIIGRTAIFQVGFDRRGNSGFKRTFIVSKIFPSNSTSTLEKHGSETIGSSKKVPYLDFPTEVQKKTNPDELNVEGNDDDDDGKYDKFYESSSSMGNISEVPESPYDHKGKKKQKTSQY